MYLLSIRWTDFQLNAFWYDGWLIFLHQVCVDRCPAVNEFGVRNNPVCIDSVDTSQFVDITNGNPADVAARVSVRKSVTYNPAWNLALVWVYLLWSVLTASHSLSLYCRHFLNTLAERSVPPTMLPVLRVGTSLSPRPKTNPSADHFQYHVRYTGSDIRAGWGLGTRLGRYLIVYTMHVYVSCAVGKCCC